MSSWDSKLVIILPAYNESKNLRILLRKICDVVAHARIIIVDDSDPPENAKVIETAYHNVEVITRQKKLGRGSAVLDGFEHALKDKSLEYFIEMDTDLSHDPLQIPLLKETLVKNKAHLVVGSRYLKGSKIVKWPRRRIIMSKIINFNLSLWLGVNLHDFTNGYRLYKRNAVKELIKVGLNEKGFIALSESVYILNKKGYRIVEVPITFIDRIHGTSTVGMRELYNSLVGAFRIKIRKSPSERRNI
jgi:dolichol-phosphate mannosyltransferase